MKRSEENAKHLTDQKIVLIPLNFAKLTSAIKAHLLEETSKETYSILKYLHDYFSRFTNANDSLRQLHPNAHDTKTIILAYYLLNDIMLGSIIGDEEIGEEQKELLMTLEGLAQSTKLKININAIQTVISKLGDETGKESVIEKSRMLFRQELKNLITE